MYLIQKDGQHVFDSEEGRGSRYLIQRQIQHVLDAEKRITHFYSEGGTACI